MQSPWNNTGQTVVRLLDALDRVTQAQIEDPLGKGIESLRLEVANQLLRNAIWHVVSPDADPGIVRELFPSAAAEAYRILNQFPVEKFPY